jgi:hypothetical protein
VGKLIVLCLLILSEFLALSEEVSPSAEEVPTRDLLKPGERIFSYFKCSRINPFSKRDGEIVIGENDVYFFDDGKAGEKKKKIYR